MTIDLDRDVLLTFPEAARLAGNVNLSTLHRWRLRGVRSIKLACFKIGGKRLVSRRALEEFIAHCSASDGTAPTTASMSKQRAREIAAAEARCTAAGI